MLKISKLTDYALIILCDLDENKIISAKELSIKTRIPLPTTNKILKKLLISNICKSLSGKNGGFLLNKNKSTISIYDVITSIETTKPFLTECGHDNNSCQLINHCKISSKMNAIDKEIHNIISNKFISDLN